LGILTQIVAAEEDEYVAIGESLRPLEEWSGIERRGIDTAKVATLHCLLTGEEFDLAISAYEPVHVGGEGAVVLRLADEVTERLATMDEEALELVAGTGGTGGHRGAGFRDGTVGSRRTCWRWSSTSAADLARLADAQGAGAVRLDAPAADE
jgi:hypothetical protein